MIATSLSSRTPDEWAALPRSVGDPLYGDFALGEFVRTTSIKDLLLEVTAHPADSLVEEHAHPTPLLLFVLDGAIEERLGGRVVKAEQGTLLVRPAYTPHTVRALRRSRVFSIEPGAQWLAQVGAAGLISALPTGEWTDRYTSLALKVYGAFAQLGNSPSAELVVQGYVQALLGELVQPLEGSGVPLWLRDVRKTLDDDPRQRLDLDRLAERAGVHPVHLSRAFRKHFGLTMTAHLRQARLSAAMVKLSTTDDSIAEVAAQTGFADASHLAREFRRAVGGSPAGYRGSVRERTSN